MGLSFKTHGGELSPGCNYVVVTWWTGGVPVPNKATAANRRIASCHRTAKKAKAVVSDRLAAMKENPGFLKRTGLQRTWGVPKVAAYNVTTGKRIG